LTKSSERVLHDLASIDKTLISQQPPGKILTILRN
jgi:hypothetical protein